MNYKTETIFQTDANGFQTMRKEIVDRQKARETRMSAISNGLEKEAPKEVNLEKMDMKALIADVKKEARTQFNTQEGSAVLSAAKIVINNLVKELDGVKAGISFAKLSRMPDKMDRIKGFIAKAEQLEFYLSELTNYTGFTVNYSYEYSEGNFSVNQ